MIISKFAYQTLAVRVNDEPSTTIFIKPLGVLIKSLEAAS